MRQEELIKHQENKISKLTQELASVKVQSVSKISDLQQTQENLAQKEGHIKVLELKLYKLEKRLELKEIEGEEL